MLTADLGNLPQSPLGDWMAAKQPKISSLNTAADQVAIVVTALPQLATAVQRVSPDPSPGFGHPPGQGPPLVPDENGNALARKTRTAK